VLYPQLNRVTPMGIYSGEHLFQVAGIYRSGFYEFDRALIIGTISDARSILFTNELFASMDIKLKGTRMEDAFALATRYGSLLGADLVAYPVVGSGLLRTVTMQKWLIFIVFSFLVLIAGINVISAVSTMIFDKKNEIAVLKTLGATTRTIRRVVDYQILLVCFGAILIGQAFGAALSWLVVKQSFYHLKGDVYFIDRLEHHISLLNLLAVLAVAATLVILCVWLPSRRIERLQIIDLLRNP
jgi:lipoprotein-releasing system permease protein